MSEVYKAISAVQGELAKTGIAKNRKNQQGSGYMFRGIDDVYAALSPLLSTHGLCVIPRMIDREVVERSSKSGGALFYTTVKAEFDFVAVADGSKHTACTYGEAMDSGDKSTNKAMSAAYKYAAFLAFAIPTEGDNDADGHTHEVAANDRAQHDVVPADGPLRSKPVKLAGPYTSKTGLWAAVRSFDRELRSCGDSDELSAFLELNESRALLDQCERDFPFLVHGGPEAPPEYEPLYALIAKMRTDLEAAENYRSPIAAG